MTGFKGSTLENTASEQQLKDYANVLSDTNYLKNADMGKMGGSPTYQNMKLDEKSNPIMDLAGQVPLKGVSMSTLKAIKDFVYKPANKAYKDELVQALLAGLYTKSLIAFNVLILTPFNGTCPAKSIIGLDFLSNCIF